MLSVSRCTLRSRAVTNSLRNAVGETLPQIARSLASSSRPRATALRRQDQHADGAEHAGGENTAHVGRRRGRDDADERAESERARPHRRRRRHGRSCAIGERLWPRRGRSNVSTTRCAWRPTESRRAARSVWKPPMSSPPSMRSPCCRRRSRQLRARAPAIAAGPGRPASRSAR